MESSKSLSVEDRLSLLESQFRGPWTDPNSFNQDSAADRIAQLELQVKGLMLFANHYYEVWKAGFELGNIPPPDSFLEAARANLNFSSQTRDPQVHYSQDPGSVEAPPSIESLSMSTPYEYHPLNPENSEIRVFALRPGTKVDEPVSGRLVTMPLDQAKFVTLSYTWGTVSKSKSILIDNQTFPVTKSLHKALHHFRELSGNVPAKARYKDQETYWWIDAICINQADVEERNSQVSLMTRLYKRCQATYVWLGEESQDSDLAMQLLQELGYQPASGEEKRTWEYIRKPGQTHRPGGPGQPPVELPVEVELTQSEKEANSKAIVSLFQRPWWSRVWVRQEVAFCEEVEVHCGDSKCKWDEVVKAARALSFVAEKTGYRFAQELDASSKKSSTLSYFQVVTMLGNIRTATGPQHLKYIQLDTLLALTRNLASTDPRDKVYAMLGITDPSLTALVPDYRKTTKDVYIEAGLDMLKAGLEYFHTCNNPERENGIPSWAPNLLAPREYSGGHGVSSSYMIANPMFGLDMGKLDFSYSPDDHSLTIKASFHNEVRVICSDSEQTLDSWYDFHRANGNKALVSVQTRDKWEKHVSSEFNSEEMVDIVEEWEPLKGRPVEDDPSIRRIQQKLLPSSFNTELRRESKLQPSWKGYKDSPEAAVTRMMAAGGRAVCLTDGTLALAPMDTKPTDRICRFLGWVYSYALREVAEKTYMLVGRVCKYQDPWKRLIIMLIVDV